MVPAAADAVCVRSRGLRRIRRLSRLLGRAGLAIAVCAAAFALACADEAEPVPEQAQTQRVPPPQTQREPAQQSAAQQAAQPAQASAPARSPGDPIALLLAEAAALERNGYWAQALGVRDAAIARAAVGTLDETAVNALRLDQVRLLLRLDQPADAVSMLAALTEPLTDDDTRRRALLTAQTALRLNQPDAAVASLIEYVNSDSPAWAVVALEAAKALQSAGRGEEAIDWAERALGGTLPFADQLRAIHIAATELDIAGESERALAHYEELLQRSPWRDDQAAALSRTGALQRQAGDFAAAQEAWRRLVEDYSEYSESVEALALLQETGAAVDRLTVGLIRYREGLWVEARAALLDVLASGSSDLAARVAGEFYIAAIHEGNGVLGSAAPGYRVVIGRDPTDPLAAEASMRLAEFAVAEGDLGEAEDQWRRVMLEHPQHARAPEAARRWAAAAAARGEWAEAAQRFRDAANDGADDWGRNVRQEFLLWAALMNREAGDRDAFQDLAEKVIAVDPLSYYGLRAAWLLEQAPPGVLELALADWLERLTGEREPAAVNLERDNHWRAAQDLRRGGFDAAADRVLSAWVEALSDDPWALVEAARVLAEAGEYTGSARAAARVLLIFDVEWAEAPPELLRLAYPQPWPEVMALHAAGEGVNPLLLWSLIRRESFYDPNAEGLAGEVGLTQVIPLTGSDIAAGLGITYAHADLARPQLAIHFGAWYLARQLAGFSNEPVMALAAYNAGPGNAARWETEAVLAGIDGFLAALDFPSTRIYVQYVIESLAVYEALERAAALSAEQ